MVLHVCCILRMLEKWISHMHAHALSQLYTHTHTRACMDMPICDRIWENPPYGIRARFAQSAFLVAHIKICQSPDFVIYMSNNPCNCCRLLRRLVVLYEGEINLHFDPPSRHTEPVAMSGN